MISVDQNDNTMVKESFSERNIIGFPPETTAHKLDAEIVDSKNNEASS